MSDIPPDWAIDKALYLMGDGDINASFVKKSRGGTFAIRVEGFANYIAAHEEPPVDPLLIEARTIAADTLVEVGGIASGMLNCVRVGGDDNNLYVKAALTALRRGMELAREQQP